MVRRILTTILLTSLCAFGAEYQLANRAGYPLGRNADKQRAAAQSSTYPANVFLTGQNDSTNALYDFSVAKSDVSIVSNMCATLDGVADKLVFTNLTGVGIASYSGTSTPSISGTNILFTAGTSWDLVLTNAAGIWAKYPLASGAGTTAYDVSGNGRHRSFSLSSSEATLWSGRQNSSAPNTLDGCSKLITTDGSASYIYTVIQVSPTVDFSITADWSGAAINSRIGGLISDTQRFYINKISTTVLRVVIGISASYIDVTVPSTGFYTIRIKGSGEIYMNGVLKGTSATPITTTGSKIFIGAYENAGSPYSHGALTISSFSLNGTTYNASEAINTGVGSATFINGVALKYIPCLTSGTNDVLGLGLTNPSGYVHNNSESLLSIGGTNYSYSAILTNGYFNIQTNANGFIKELWK